MGRGKQESTRDKMDRWGKQESTRDKMDRWGKQSRDCETADRSRRWIAGRLKGNGKGLTRADQEPHFARDQLTIAALFT